MGLESWVSPLHFSGFSLSSQSPCPWSFIVSKTRNPLLRQMVLTMPLPTPTAAFSFPSPGTSAPEAGAFLSTAGRGEVGGCLLLTSSVDSTSLPVPGARRRLKLLALLSLPLHSPTPCFPGKPVGPVGGRRHQSQWLLSKVLLSSSLPAPSPPQGNPSFQLQFLSRHDLILFSHAL